MIAKQTRWSASLVVWFGASVAYAEAEPEAPPQTDDEARPEPVDVSARTVVPGPPPPPPPAPLRRKPTGRFEIGAGFSTDESFVATATVAQDDLFGTGTQLSLNTRISAQRQLFLLRVADPSVLGSQLSLTTDFYADSRLMPGFSHDAVGYSVTASHPLGKHWRAFVGTRLEQIMVAPETAASPRGGEVLPPLEGGLLHSMSAGLSYSSLDTPLMPMTGTSAGASIEVADRRLGSELELTRVRGWANHHRPVGPFTLHVGGTVAAVTGPYGAPRSERLFLDGSRDIRGYQPFALGPVDALGTPIGGNLKLTGRAELEVPLIKRIGLSAAAFVDAGGIFDHSDGQIGASAGFGLIWRSPIGPLRFDWAFPLDGGKPGFVFGIGSSW